VRVEDGETLTTEGSFAETKEAIGGYLLFEAEDFDTAIELASRDQVVRPTRGCSCAASRQRAVKARGGFV